MSRKDRAPRDLTQGSVAKHLLGMAAFIGIGLIVQTMYFLVDLYFVSHLGRAAIAGVSSAGTTNFIIMAASQLVAVGSLSLVSQAIGRKDDADAQLVFDQALSLALFASVLTLILGYTVGTIGVESIGADAATAAEGRAYLLAFIPSLALMFPMSAIGSALRAAGVVGPPMAIQSMTVVVNAILAPVLIAGWGTGHPLGVAGAGLASSIATLVGVTAFVLMFGRMQSLLVLHISNLKPKFAVWRRICAVGLPASAEFALMFVVSIAMYWIIRGYGAEAQAGFGIGSRISQSIFLPAMAVAFAAAPIAGQNFGAKLPDRVRATFRASALISAGIMLALTLLCRWRPEVLVHPFTTDPAVVLVAADYLRISSWNFVAIGLVFACSGMFQAFGDTVPSMLSSASRLVTFVLPAIALTYAPGVQLHDFWKLSVASVALQAVTSLFLLRRHMARKLEFAAPPMAAAIV